MGVYLTLTRRELGSFFCSWIGYVVIAGAAFVTGFSFYTLARQLQGESMSMPVTGVFLNLLFWVMVLFSAPLITMRLFSLEKHTGTFETLMTAPVGDLEVVLAKFSAALIFFLLMWLPLAGCVFLLRAFTRGGIVDGGTLLSTYLGIFLLGCLYMAVGCFASSLTRNQVNAAILTFVIGVVLFLAGFLVGATPMDKNWQIEVLNAVSVRRQMEEFARGVIDTRSIVFFTTTAAFFLFLTCRSLESRRWK